MAKPRKPYILMADKAYSHIYISNATDNSYHPLLYDSNQLQTPSFHGAPAPPATPYTAGNSSTYLCILAASIPTPSSSTNSRRPPLPELRHTKVINFFLADEKTAERVFFLYLIMQEEEARGRRQPPQQRR